MSCFPVQGSQDSLPTKNVEALLWKIEWSPSAYFTWWQCKEFQGIVAQEVQCQQEVSEASVWSQGSRRAPSASLPAASRPALGRGCQFPAVPALPSHLPQSLHSSLPMTPSWRLKENACLSSELGSSAPLHLTSPWLEIRSTLWPPSWTPAWYTAPNPAWPAAFATSAAHWASWLWTRSSVTTGWLTCPSTSRSQAPVSSSTPPPECPASWQVSLGWEQRDPRTGSRETPKKLQEATRHFQRGFATASSPVPSGKKKRTPSRHRLWLRFRRDRRAQTKTNLRTCIHYEKKKKSVQRSTNNKIHKTPPPTNNDC